VEIYAKPRQGGKTTDLIRLAADGFLYIVCVNHAEAYRIAEQAREMGFDIPFPMTWNEFVHDPPQGRQIKGFVIDNLDLCIQMMVPEPIRAVSLTMGAAVLPGAVPG
jgi:hypothetical protein